MEVGEKIVGKLQYVCAFAFAPTISILPFPANAFVSIADRTEEGYVLLSRRQQSEVRTQYRVTRQVESYILLQSIWGVPLSCLGSS